MSIVKAVNEIGGRFIDKDDTGRWYDIGEQRAFDKVSQALREGQPQLRNKLEQHQDMNPTLASGLLPGTASSTSSLSPSHAYLDRPIESYDNNTGDTDADFITTTVLRDLLRSSQTNSLHSMRSDMLQSEVWSNMVREMDYNIPSVPRSSILSSFVVSDLEMLRNFNFLEDTAELLEDIDNSRVTSSTYTSTKRRLSLASKSDNERMGTFLETMDFDNSKLLGNFGDPTVSKRARRGSIDDSYLDPFLNQSHVRKRQMSCNFNDDTLLGLVSTTYEPVVRQETNDLRSRRLSVMLLDFADEIVLGEQLDENYGKDE